ncbi:hypothetical protein MHK_001854 [Candidatus Magnetomorum sp. HK-1]|nr:hypothetical protein MHK_001854 [Candidatus Magnetomorum sp. HK-1]
MYFLSRPSEEPKFIIENCILKPDAALVIQADNKKANQKKRLNVIFDGYPFPKKGIPIDISSEGMQQWSFLLKQYTKNEILIKDGIHKIKMGFPGDNFSDEYKIIFISKPPIVNIKKSNESGQTIIEGKVTTELQLPKKLLSVCVRYFQDGISSNLDNIPLTKKIHNETGITYFEFKTVLQGLPVLISDNPNYSKPFWGIKVIDQAGNDYYYEQSYAKFMAPGDENFGVGSIANIKIKKISEDIKSQELSNIIRIIPNPTIINRLPNGKPPIELKVQSIGNAAKLEWKYNITSFDPLTIVYKDEEKIGTSLINEFIDNNLIKSDAKYRVEKKYNNSIYSSDSKSLSWIEYYKKSELYIKREKYSDALIYLDKAIKYRNDDTRKFNYFPHREKGIVHYYLGEYKKALEELILSLKYVNSNRALSFLDRVRKRINNIKKDYSLPIITIVEPKNNTHTNIRNLILSGTIQSDQYISKVQILNKDIDIDKSVKKFNLKEKISLVEGENIIEISAENLFNMRTQKSLSIFLDQSGPTINIHEIDSNQIKGNVYDASGISMLKIDDKIIFDSIKNKYFEFDTYVSFDDKYLIALDLVGNTTKIKLDLLKFGIYLQNDIPKVVYVESLNLELYVKCKNNLKSIYINNNDVLKQFINSKYISISERIQLNKGLNTIFIRVLDVSGNIYTKSIKIDRKLPKVLNLKYRAVLKIQENIIKKQSNSFIFNNIFKLFLSNSNKEYRKNLDYFINHFKKSIKASNRFQICEDNNYYDILCDIRYIDTYKDTEIIARLITRINSKIVAYVDVYENLGNKDKQEMLSFLAKKLAKKIKIAFPIYKCTIISKVNENQYLIKNDLDIITSQLFPSYPLIIYRDSNPESEFGSESIIIGQGHITETYDNNTVLLELDDNCKIGDKVISQ